jgi:hypothetical protein
MSFHLLWFTPFHRDIFLVTACLFFLTVRPSCEVVIQSLHFLFFILNKKKYLIFHYGIFTFDYISLILTHVERLHFIEIVDIALGKMHLESYRLFEIQD